VLDVSNKGLAKIKALNGSGVMNAAKTTFVSDVQSNSAVAQKLMAAAKAGNQKTYIALAEQLNATNNTTDSAGSKLGAPACATSSPDRPPIDREITARATCTSRAVDRSGRRF
jgi:hypothetical protein